MPKKTLKITYPSLERLLQDYSHIKSGILFLPTQNPLPMGTELVLKISVPEINQTFQVDCTVSKLTGSLPDNPLKQHPGMQLSLERGSESFITELSLALRHAAKRISNSNLARPSKDMSGTEISKESIRKPFPGKYPAKKMDEKPLPSNKQDVLEENNGSKLSMGWIKKALQREKEEFDEEPIDEPVRFVPPTEKKDLTPEERRKVEPVGEFVMDLTKAMLRSGYYSPDHPGSMQAKQGLYKRFRNILGDANEILIANRESREKKDFLIMGILDEPISIKLLVGTSRAELFEPKLREYFNRKGLMSFAIKDKITLDHFDTFIDIMCDPRTDDVEQHKIGDLLTRQLIENGITEISSNFIEDKLFFKENLPWRVEMAIQRLAKDLKILPQFTHASDEKLKTMKIDIIRDILRPLKHPDLLKELIINCYVIVENVKHLDLEEIEQTLVSAFPIPFLHATSLSIFRDIEKYKEEVEKYRSDPDVAKRYNSMKRILKLIASRMIMESTPRVQSFLEKLYFSKLLTYEELPSSVKYQIDTTLMVEDLKANTRYYENAISHAQSSESGMVLIKWFHRIAPRLIKNKDWDVMLKLLSTTGRADTDVAIFPRIQGHSLNPFTIVFNEFTDELAAAYNNPDDNKRQLINDILLNVGPIGIEVYGKILSESENPAVRKAAIASLGKRGEVALKWARQVLDHPDNAWHLHRNALLIMNKAGGSTNNDIKRVVQFLKHNNSRVREEALKTIIDLRPEISEPFIVDAVNDENEKIKLRALHALGNVSSLSEKSITKLMHIISSELPEDKRSASAHSQKVTHIIQIISIKASPAYKELIEKTLLHIISRTSKDQSWFSKIVKSSVNDNQVRILHSAAKTLNNIGSTESISTLHELIKSKNPYAKFLKDALESDEKK